MVSGETLMKHFHSCVQEFDDHFKKVGWVESHLRFREIIALGGVHQILLVNARWGRQRG